MAEAQRDGNRVPTLLGVSDADGITPLAAVIDHLTGRGLASITAVTAPTSVMPVAPAPRDGNWVAVGMGVSDLDGVTPLPIMMDRRNGLIYGVFV